AEQRPALADRLADPGEIGVLEVADPPVHHPERAGRGRLREVPPLDQGHAEAPKRGVPGGADPEDPSAHHGEIELRLLEGAQVPPHQPDPAGFRPTAPIFLLKSVLLFPTSLKLTRKKSRSRVSQSRAT